MNRRGAVLPFLVLLAGSAGWFWSELTWATARPDESAYFDGFSLALHGASPYGAERFIYTPVFARAGAFALGHLGFFATAAGLRLVNLLSVCALTFCALGRCPSVGRARVLVALAVAIAFRPLSTSLGLGNLSPFPAALTFLGLLAVPGAPVLSGVLIGIGLGLKPAGLPALAVLAAHRSPMPARPRVIAIGVACLVTASLLSVDAGLLPEMLRSSHDVPDASTNLAPARLAAAIGLHVPSALFAVSSTLACVLWARACPLGEKGLAAIGGFASLVWLPRVWLHSFSMIVPAVLFATDRAVTRYRASRREAPEAPGARAGRQRALLVLTWTLLGGVCIEFADAWGDLARVVPALPWAEAWNAAVPLVAATLLVQYAASRDDT